MISKKLEKITQGLLNAGYSRGKLKLPLDKEKSIYSEIAVSQIKDLLPSEKDVWNIMCDYFKNKVIKDVNFLKKVTYKNLKVLAKLIHNRIHKGGE